MTQESRHRLRTLTVLAMLCLSTVLWLPGDADTVPPPAPAAAARITGPTWGVEDPLTRLLPIDTYAGPLAKPISLSGARNEVADKQLVLFTGARAWTGVQIAFSDLHGPHKSVLAGTLLHWRRIGSVRTTQPYYQTRYVGLWPDPLLPAAPFSVPAQGRALAWIDLHIPPEARPGDYSGTVSLTSPGAAAVRVPLSLHVWGFTLPRQNHLRTSFGYQGQGHFPLDVSALFDDLLAHRITPENAVGDPKMNVSPGHPAAWDWTQYDQNVRHRLSQGMTGVRIWLPPPVAVSAQIWQAHLQQKGWLALAYTYIADEPLPEQFAALSDQFAQIKRAAPGLRNMMTAPGYPAKLTGVDIWSPDIIFFNPDASRREQAQGCESWWYPAYPTQHPLINVWTDYPLLDCRVWPWMTWKYDLDGMLYWDVTYWQNTPDPLTSAPTLGGTYGTVNGDGQLVYPGPGGRPLDSMRLEALRDGLQDYEVFCLLEAGVRELRAARGVSALAGQGQALLAIDPTVVASYTQYNPDPAALLAAREQMSRAVERITAVLGHEPRITGRPRSHPEISALQSQAWSAAGAKTR